MMERSKPTKLPPLPESIAPLPIPQRPIFQFFSASSSLGCKLNLLQVAQNSWNVEYGGDRSQVIMRIRKPSRVTATIYPSGKMLLLGAKTEEKSLLASHEIARKIDRLGYNAKVSEFKIVVFVLSFHVRTFSHQQTLSF
jgi:transcription initiation factor TFIID TATA-box-binding protein